MNASLARRTKQLPELDIYTSPAQFSQLTGLTARSEDIHEPSTNYATSMVPYPAYMTAEEPYQPQYSPYGLPYTQYQPQTNTQQTEVEVTPLDPQLTEPDLLPHTNDKYIGYASGLPLLAELLQVMSLPPSIPWPHLACDSFLAEMRSSVAIASLPIPCRKTSSLLLDTYDEIVSPLYPVYTRTELQSMLNDIYLNGIIARRDIAECTSNCFALVIGQVIGFFAAAQNPSLEKMARDCANFTRSGLAEVFLRPSICGLRYLLCILLTNHSSELADPIWYTSGMAMQMCVDLNLHCEVQSSITSQVSETDIDERRRVFWSTYAIDRGLALAFGRPLTLNESAISCPFPKLVSTMALNRFKIRRLQARIMTLHLQYEKDSITSLPFPSKDEQQLMHDVVQWSVGTVGEEAIQGGNTELLLLRRGITNHQPKAMLRAVEIVAQNMLLYRTEALQIARIEGILLSHDIFVNLITALYIYKFGEHCGGVSIQMLWTWIEMMRPIFAQLSRQWSTARESFYLVENLFYKLQEGQA